MYSRSWPLLLLLAGPALAAQGYMIGAGAEGDDDAGLSVAALGGIGFTDRTWLSVAMAKSSVDLASGRELDTLFADLELDHFFDPVGVRVAAGYWGDADVLESDDWRGSVYFRNDSAEVSLDYEFRDFTFIIPAGDVLPSRRIDFDADGFGASARFRTSERTQLRLRGIKYDYSLPFRPIDNVDAARLISGTRLSLVNSLVDHRASVSLSLDQGQKNWVVEAATWENVLDRSRTISWTLRLLLPLTAQTDVELGLGYDDSELYGGVVFFSLYLFLYGG